MNCDGGEEPFRMAPATSPAPVAAYPNPANNDLTLEQVGGTVHLYNAYGLLVRSQTAKPGRLHIDTSSLPTGLYYLELPAAKGKLVRQQVRVVH